MTSCGCLVTAIAYYNGITRGPDSLQFGHSELDVVVWSEKMSFIEHRTNSSTQDSIIALRALPMTPELPNTR